MATGAISVGNEYLFGKGKVMLLERDVNGVVSEGLYVGNCPELRFSSSAGKFKHLESMTGTNAQDREIITQITMEMSVTLENIADEVLATLVWGETNAIAAATTQSHFFPAGIANGEHHIIPNAWNLSNAVLKDSAGSPATVDSADYLLDTDFGTIKFIDVTGYTQPFELEYDKGAAVGIPFLKTTQPARFLRFEGKNLGNPGLSYSDTFIVELYNIGFDPPADLGFIGSEFARFELKGSVNSDDTRSDDNTLGAYGRIIKIT
jgi:hypothetical protein